VVQRRCRWLPLTRPLIGLIPVVGDVRGPLTDFLFAAFGWLPPTVDYILTADSTATYACINGRRSQPRLHPS